MGTVRPRARETILVQTRYACVIEAHESTRSRIGPTEPRYHEEAMDDNMFNSLSQYNLAHKPEPCAKQWRTSCCLHEGLFSRPWLVLRGAWGLVCLPDRGFSTLEFMSAHRVALGRRVPPSDMAHWALELRWLHFSFLRGCWQRTSRALCTPTSCRVKVITSLLRNVLGALGFLQEQPWPVRPRTISRNVSVPSGPTQCCTFPRAAGCG